MGEGKLYNGKEAAPTYYYCTAVDQNEQIELVVSGVLVEERGKSTNTSTILKAEKACQGQGLFFGTAASVDSGCCFMSTGWYYCFATIKREHGYNMDFRRLDEATPKTH